MEEKYKISIFYMNPLIFFKQHKDDYTSNKNMKLLVSYNHL